MIEAETPKSNISSLRILSNYSNKYPYTSTEEPEESSMSSSSRISMSKKTLIKTIASIVRETDLNERKKQ